MTTNNIFPSEPPVPPPKEAIVYPGTRSIPARSEFRAASEQSTPSRQSRISNVICPSSTSSEHEIPNTSVDQSISKPLPLESNGAWSTAVGRATTGGKSGRVIERLMNENDRLLREKKLATVKLEEEVKRAEFARSALESLQLSNANLTSLHESGTTLLAKRDRRIQQLRDDLQAERAKRESAERETLETQRERNATIEVLQRQAAEHKESCLRSTSQYEMLSRSWSTLEDRYKQSTQRLRVDMVDLMSTIEQDRKRLAQMEIVMEQMAKESEKTKKAKDRLAVEFERYRADHEYAIKDIRETAARNDRVNDETQRQMLDVLGHMRYVVNVSRDTRNAA